jgi:hypothetical protein
MGSGMGEAGEAGVKKEEKEGKEENEKEEEEEEGSLGGPWLQALRDYFELHTSYFRLRNPQS